MSPRARITTLNLDSQSIELAEFRVQPQGGYNRHMSADTIGIILSVLFGIASIYFYLRSRRVKRLACLVGTITVQKRSHPEIEISFRGTQIANLSRMLVFLWNRGTMEIRSSDIPPGHQPLLSLHKEARILSVALIESSGPHNQVRCDATTAHEVQFTFDYLNPSDGCVVEVLFDGGDRNVAAASFTAPIVGGRPPIFSTFEPSISSDSGGCVLGAAVYVIMGFWLWMWPLPVERGMDLLLNLMAPWMFLLGVIFLLATWWLEVRRRDRYSPRFAKLYFNRLISGS